MQFQKEKFGSYAPAWQLRYFETLDSTNAEAKRELQHGEAESGHVYLAEQQTAGVGRRGSSWLCGKGEGLLFTAVIETELSVSDTGKLALSSALAVADTLCFLGIKPQLKWPNDVYVDGAKVCGILVEQVGDFSLFGIGLNTHVNFDESQNLNATSLHLHGKQEIEREKCLALVLNHLLSRVSRYEDFSTMLDDWNRWDFLKEKCVKLKIGEQVKVGNYLGISDKGALLLATEYGEEEIFNASEIRVVE